MACLFSESELAWFFIGQCSGDTHVASLVSGGELAWLLMCSVLVTQMWPVLFQEVSWPGFKCTLLVT